MDTSEVQRLSELASYEILDTEPEREFDEIVEMAALLCGVPIALISLVDEKRQWFKAKQGIEVCETAREISFCTHAVALNQTLIVEDACKDARFASSPLVVGDPKIRFYAGVLLKTKNDLNLGTLCVVDQVPRKLNPEQIRGLEILGRQVIDLFQRRRALLASLMRERILDSTMSMVPGLISYINRDQVYGFANQHFESFFGRPLSQVTNASLERVWGREAYQILLPNLQMALAGFAQDYEAEVVAGAVGREERRILHCRYVPDFAPDGKVKGICAFQTDITKIRLAEREARIHNAELKSAYNELNLSEAEFRAMFDNAPVGMAELNSDYKLVRMNSAFASMLGYEQRELLGESIMKLTHPDDRQVSNSHLEMTTREPVKVHTYEKKYLHRDGSIVHALVSSIIVKYPLYDEVRIFGVVQDTTARKQAEDQLRQAQGQLIEAAKLSSLGEMAGGIAHEINNPLAIIQGKAGLLKLRIDQGKGDLKEVAAGLEVIQATSVRIAAIVKGLRTFSSPEHAPKCFVPIPQIVSDTLALCAERYRHNAIKLHWETPPEVHVLCQAVQMSQVLMNLLLNAHDAVFGQPGAWVRMTFETSPETFQIRVTDSGLGISDQIASRIMQPFFTTKQAGKGVGLGLSISRSLMEAHQGKLNYELHHGNTSFVMSFPIKNTSLEVKSA